MKGMQILLLIIMIDIAYYIVRIMCGENQTVLYDFISSLAVGMGGGAIIGLAATGVVNKWLGGNPIGPVYVGLFGGIWFAVVNDTFMGIIGTIIGSDYMFAIMQAFVGLVGVILAFRAGVQMTTGMPEGGME